MKSHAQAVVIGGGLIGCSILYHLTKLGWKDVVLLERDELTSGSTWHAAAGIHGLHDNNNITRIQNYTMNLYKELETLTGQGCGIFQPGSLYLAQTENREHQLRLQEAKAKYYGLNFHEISRNEAERLHPLVDFDGVRTIMYEPDGGNVDPSGVTNAYANGARQNGAEIYRFTPVTGTEQLSDKSWLIKTDKGNIKTEVVINAAGLWGREVGKMAGLDLPLLPAEHQYFVTETIPEIESIGRRLPSIADRDGEYYLRQEGNGLLVGAYEKDVKLWAELETPSGFGHELFPDDLDRIEENVLRAISRVPVLGGAGIKRVINGPMIWSPDSNALFGPVPELDGYYLCNGIIPGFSQSGGLGELLAEWIITGEPHLDIFSWDLARFGTWADKKFTKSRVKDQYSNRFAIHFPNEERSAGRPVRTRPAYSTQKELGAVFGLNYGWEHPLWFSKEPNTVDSNGFTRQNWHEPVGIECNMLRNSVGVIDISNFAKYLVSGDGSESWLNSIFANRMPKNIGRSCLTPLIGKRGGIAGDFTVTHLEKDKFLIIGSGMAERYHSRYFKSVPLPGNVSFESITEKMCGFNVAGPKSREMLSRLSNADFSTELFPFMTAKRINLLGLSVIAVRVSFTGDLGWELYCDTVDQVELYNSLVTIAKELNGGPIGSRALMSLRIEKGYGSWSREYSPEYWPQEVGLSKLIKLDKDFLNKEAYIKIKDKKPREMLRIIEVVDAKIADATGGEPIFSIDGAPIGRVTSGAYCAGVGKSLALVFIKSSIIDVEMHVMILGKPHLAKLLDEPPFDPKGLKLRS
ncbi:MAG: dehydrogenase [Rhodobacteraceae bacterium]|nr:dehydrogenase [Paracoccaceae bacterium]MBT4284979.1 GcvT family protein [Paracoccaceae bacterium]|tara:strand:+ start:6353 stop:8764 length:2412 start_codon:yes stop_codon:yes gene_type:complete